MQVDARKKLEYWNHFVAREFIGLGGGGRGVTGARLRKIYSEIMKDDLFWQDIVLRHGGVDKTPEEMERDDLETYQHCLGNFWGQIYQALVEKGLIEP